MTIAPSTRDAGTEPARRPGARLARLRNLEPSMLLAVLAALVLVFMVAAPLTRLVISSFQMPDTGTPTLSNYVVAFANERRLVAFGNSLLYGVGVVVLCQVFALPIAWAIARSDLPAKSLIRATILAAFITPPYLGAIGWVLLAGPNAGWINKTFVALGGHGPLFNVYTMPGLIFVTALYAFPYVFVFTSDALDRVSSEMEEAANILGMSAFRTIFRITLPLVLPAIFSGATIVFLETVALFGTPEIIALPARINLLTLQLWTFFEFPVRVEAAAAYSLPLIAITLLLLALQRTILGRKGFVALTGKGGGRLLMPLGRWRWPVFGYCALVCTLAVFLPFTALAQAAFSRAWGRGFSWQNFTLGNFGYLLSDEMSLRTILNTFGFSAITGCVAVLLALIVAYVVARRLVPGTGVLASLAMTPIVVPGIVLALAFYAVYAAPPFALYGTAAILILGYTTRFLPIAFANCLAGLRSLNPEMEEAVRILGGSRAVAVRRVVVPMLKKSLLGSWLLVFIPAARELSTAIFLVTPNTRVISVMMLDLTENGNFELLSAVGIVLLVVTMLVVALGYRLIGSDFLLKKS